MAVISAILVSVAASVLPATLDTSAVDRAFAQALDTFAQAQQLAAESPADTATVTDRFRLAADQFERIYQSGVVSTELLTNIANARYFANQQALAVLFYRRALVADPGNTTAQTSLNTLRSTLPIRQSKLGPAGNLLNSMIFWHHGTPLATRQTALAIAWPTFWITLTISLWRRRQMRTLLVITGLIALPLAASLAVDTWGAVASDQAVLLVQTEGRRGDHASYSPSHSLPLPPGTELTILQRRTTSQVEWVQARLLDRSETWLPADRIAPVID